MQEFNDKDLYFNANKIDITAMVIALIATILIHLSAYYLVPAEFSSFTVADDKQEDLKLEILPPIIQKGAPKFVEANPFGNDMIPKEDSPESFKNQRAADEIPDPASKSKMPFVAGEIKDGKKIISGTSSEQDSMSPQAVMNVLERPLTQPAQPTEASTTAAKPATQEQKSEEKKSEGKKEDAAPEEKKEIAQDKSTDEGFLKISKREKLETESAPKKDLSQAKEKTLSQEKPEQQKEEKKVAQKDAKKPQEENIPAPQPRPALSMKIPAGPLAENKNRASAQGIVAVDSKFSEFGAYQQRMIEAISRQWNLLGSKYDLNTAYGSLVVIEFSLNSSGELVKFETLHSTSTNTGKGLCEQSILTTAPYGPWTQEMINSLGTQDQAVRITFHYR